MVTSLYLVHVCLCNYNVHDLYINILGFPEQHSPIYKTLSLVSKDKQTFIVLL